MQVNNAQPHDLVNKPLINKKRPLRFLKQKTE